MEGEARGERKFKKGNLRGKELEDTEEGAVTDPL